MISDAYIESLECIEGLRVSHFPFVCYRLPGGFKLRFHQYVTNGVSVWQVFAWKLHFMHRFVYL